MGAQEKTEVAGRRQEKRARTQPEGGAAEAEAGRPRRGRRIAATLGVAACVVVAIVLVSGCSKEEGGGRTVHTGKASPPAESPAALEFRHALEKRGWVDLAGHEDDVTSVAFSPDGRRLATGSHDGTATLWDTSTGERLITFLWHGSRACIAFSPDGRRLALSCSMGSKHGTAAVWDASAAERSGAFKGRGGYVWPSGCWLTTRTPLRTFKGHERDVTSVAFSPDGRRLATGSGDNTAALWDASTGKRLRIFKGHESRVSSVAFSPDGRRLATGSGGKTAAGSTDNTAALWDASTGERLRILAGHEKGVSSVAFSPDGRRLATGSSDTTAALWDASTGERLRIFKGAGGWGSGKSVAFSPDGLRLATPSRKDTARIWLLPEELRPGNE